LGRTRRGAQQAAGAGRAGSDGDRGADGGGAAVAAWPPARSARSLFALRRDVDERRSTFEAARLRAQTVAGVLEEVERGIR
jgi:hypothetical protein